MRDGVVDQPKSCGLSDHGTRPQDIIKISSSTWMAFSGSPSKGSEADAPMFSGARAPVFDVVPVEPAYQVGVNAIKRIALVLDHTT
jgi:hypothetical protein